MKRIALSFLLSLLVLPACSKNKSDESSPSGESKAAPAAKSTASAETAPADQDDKKVQDKMINIPNARLYNEILVGGQPSDSQYGELASAGYKVVIDLRPEQEAPANEGKTTDAGMEYVRIPVGGGGGLDKESAQALADALAKEGPKVVHCASGNRVGALFALKAAWIDGASPEEAMKVGRDSGLTGLAPKIEQMLKGQ